MAQLKDTVISGSLRVTDTTYTTTADVSFIKASTAAGATAHGTGTAGQALFSNGASAAYWGSTAHQHNYLPATSTDSSLKIESNILKHKTTITATANISGSAAASPAFGGTFAVPYFSIDGFGHSTAVGAKTITIPSATYTTASATTNGAIGLVPAPTSGQQDFILSAGKKWVSSAHTHNYLPATSTDDSLKIESNTLKHKTSLTASASISGTANVSGWGQTATVVVPSIDAYGHTTACTTKTITMPSSTGLSTTDEKLKMTPASATKFYPAGGTSQTSAVSTAYFSSAVYIQGTSVVAANFVGTATTAAYAAAGPFAPETNNAGYHNSIYRGKSLGTSITAEQWAAISAGTFDDMYIGDYWTLSTTLGETTSNVQYVIAGFDYWWNCGDAFPQSSNKHHIVLVPASNLYSATMNATNITTGGYISSLMYTDNLANARTGIAAVFGDHIYKVKRLFTNAVNSMGQATGWGWYKSSVDLMSETMVYGHPVWSSSGYEVGVDRTILPLFALNPASASIRANWWLRSVASPANFANVNNNGNANYNNASNSNGVRPDFDA